ncbi:MAG: glycosyltransferase [Candidatus Bipolaricaulota bacterium]
MKIGLFTDVYPPDIGGIEVVIGFMERILRERGHEVVTFAPAYPGHRDDGPGLYRLPSVGISKSRNWRLGYSLSGPARRAARDLDIIHSHTSYTVGLLGARVALAQGIPHVHTYHVLLQEYRRAIATGLPRAVLDGWLRLFLRRCDLVVAPSEYAREEVESYGVAVPIRVLPFGLDAADFDRPPLSSPRSELGIEEPHLLLFVGRLVEEKNVGFLLRAFRILCEQREDVRLMIVGDGPGMGDLQKQAGELGIQHRTTFCGYLLRERVIDLNRQADLFVFGSKTESQGLVILEAMMAGAPPVAVDAAGVRDILRSGMDGLLVPEDERVFAACCNDLLSDSERRDAMARSAQDRARDFTAQASVDRLIEIYEELVEQKSCLNATAGR